jgi:hypothetical protein
MTRNVRGPISMQLGTIYVPVWELLGGRLEMGQLLQDSSG